MTKAYELLESFLSLHPELRGIALEEGVVISFIKRVGQLTGEKERTHGTSDQILEKPKRQKTKEEKPAADANAAKKGVGYTTLVGASWDVAAYIKEK